MNETQLYDKWYREWILREMAIVNDTMPTDMYFGEFSYEVMG